MKHCHFSILCDELPCLRQKVPFLYAHFDQLIFYDLNVVTHEFSTDGSHEYLRDFPDPEGKLTLIEEPNARELRRHKGSMFKVGSKLVRDDIDVFWCTDMDEFFEESLIVKVEQALGAGLGNCILLPHLVFFHNERWVFCPPAPHTERMPLPWSRVARHRPGNHYRHCQIADQYAPAHLVQDETMWHFAYVGDAKMKFKTTVHLSKQYYEEVWKQFDESQVTCAPGELWGFPHMHPGGNLGIKRYTGRFPSYLHVDKLMRDLGVR